MKKDIEIVNMDKYQEALKTIKTRKLEGDFSWLKKTGKHHLKQIEDEIKRLELEKQSPTEQALAEFKDDSTYDFLDVINDAEIRKEHQIKQAQKKEYDDNEFLEKHQDKQG